MGAPGDATIPRVDGLDLERGTYETPPRRLSTFTRWFPSVQFYAAFASIVTSSANQAKRGDYDDERWALSSHATRRRLEEAGLRISVTGLDHVRDLDGPCVFVGNHMSMLETLLLPGFIQPLRPGDLRGQGEPDPLPGLQARHACPGIRSSSRAPTRAPTSRP